MRWVLLMASAALLLIPFFSLTANTNVCCTYMYHVWLRKSQYEAHGGPRSLCSDSILSKHVCAPAADSGALLGYVCWQR